MWDIETEQFVLNEQLMGIAMAEATANPDTQQVDTWIRHHDNGIVNNFYEYQDGKFVLVVNEWHFGRFDENGQFIHWETIRTNKISGEITVEVIPFDD
jgi:hypothetical protein